MSDKLIFAIAAILICYMVFASFGNEAGRYVIETKDNYNYEGKSKEDTTFLVDTKTGDTWVYNGSWNRIQYSKY